MRHLLCGLFTGLLAWIAIAIPASAVETVFDFNGDFNATAGPATMGLFKGVPFGSFGTDTINGAQATVYNFPAAQPDQGLEVIHNAPPNGGGAYVNEFTVGYDIKFTGGSPWAAFLQTNVNNANDSDLFRDPAGGIGISGIYDGTMVDNNWYRVMFVFDLADVDGDGKTLYKYINGALVGTQNPGGLDGRFALDPSFILLTDNDGETSAGAINSFFFADRPLTAAEVRQMGSATAAGFGGGAAIPEPATLSLLGLGALLSIRRKRS